VALLCAGIDYGNPRDAERVNANAQGVSFAAVSTLLQRLEMLVERAGVSQRERSRRAGLTDVHVGQLMRRLKASPNASFETKTLQAIAGAAGVSAAWLLTGDGSPDSDDATRAPSTTDDPEPILRNVPGWATVVAIDTAEHAITPEEIDHGEKIAAFMLHRPAVPGDLWEIVQQIRRVNDPTWLAQKLQESHARVQALLAKAPEQLAWEREQIARKQAKERNGR